MAKAAILERINRDFLAAASELPAAAIALSARKQAAEELARLGWPSGRDEQWRYANLREFERIGRFSPAPASTASEATLALPPALPGFERLLFVDGVRAHGGS